MKQFLTFVVVNFFILNVFGYDIGESVKDFTLKDEWGAEHKLSSFVGKNVVLEWYNIGCPFVRKHYDSENMQGTQKEAKEIIKSADTVWLRIVSSAPEKQGYVDPAKLTKKNRNAYLDEAYESHTLLDPTGEVGKLFGAKTTPHMFIINKERKLVYNGAIDSVASANKDDVAAAENYVKTAIRDIASGNDVKTAKTRPYGCSVKYQ